MNKKLMITEASEAKQILESIDFTNYTESQKQELNTAVSLIDKTISNLEK